MAEVYLTPYDIDAIIAQAEEYDFDFDGDEDPHAKVRRLYDAWLNRSPQGRIDCNGLEEFWLATLIEKHVLAKHEPYEDVDCGIEIQDSRDNEDWILFTVKVEGGTPPDPTVTISFPRLRGADNVEYQERKEKRLAWQTKKHADRIRKAYSMVLWAFDGMEEIPELEHEGEETT
jgi:hypothetical protein